MKADRFERVKRKGIRVTERDFKTIEAVFEARYLTNKMIAQLFYSPTAFSWCKQRIRYLFDLGYIKKRKAYINEPDIYFLGLRGKRYIASRGGYTKDQVDRIAGVSGGNAEAPVLMMNHDLTLSQLYVNARIEARTYGWVIRWKNTRMLQLEKLGFEPDAWIEVGSAKGTKEAFVEYTSVVPTSAEMRRKVTLYETYWERTGKPIPVLWFGATEGKAKKIRESLLKVRYRDYFLVGLIGEAGQFLTAPIWKWSERNEPIRWIEAEQAVFSTPLEKGGEKGSG